MQPQRPHISGDEYRKLRALGHSDADIRAEVDVDAPTTPTRSRMPLSAAPADATGRSSDLSIRNPDAMDPLVASGIVAADQATMGLGKHLFGDTGRETVENARSSLGPLRYLPEAAGFMAGAGPRAAGALMARGLPSKATAATIGGVMGGAEGKNAKGVAIGAGLGAGLGAASEAAVPYAMGASKWLWQRVAKFSEPLRQRYGTERAAELAKKAATQMFPGRSNAVGGLTESLTPGSGGMADEVGAIGLNAGDPLATMAHHASRKSPEAFEQIGRGLAGQESGELARVTSAIEQAFNAPSASVRSIMDELQLPQTPYVEALVKKAMAQTDANAPAAMDRLRQELVQQIRPQYEPLISQHNNPIDDPKALEAIAQAEDLLGRSGTRRQITTAGKSLGHGESEFFSSAQASPEEVAGAVLDRQPMLEGWREWPKPLQDQAISKTVSELRMGMHGDVAESMQTQVPTSRYAHELKQRVGARAQFGPLPGEVPSSQTDAALKASHGALRDVTSQSIPGISDIDAQYAANQGQRSSLRSGGAAGTPEEITLRVGQAQDPDMFRKGLTHRALTKIRSAPNPLQYATKPGFLARLRAGAVDEVPLNDLVTRQRQSEAVRAGSQAMDRTPQELVSDMGTHDPALYRAANRDALLGKVGSGSDLFRNANRRYAATTLADNPVPLEKALAREDVFDKGRREVGIPGSHPATEIASRTDSPYSVRHVMKTFTGDPGGLLYPGAEMISHAARSSLDKIEQEAYTQLAPVLASELRTGKSADALRGILGRAEGILRQRGLRAESIRKIMAVLSGTLAGQLGGAISRDEQ